MSAATTHIAAYRDCGAAHKARPPRIQRGFRAILRGMSTP
jgi:hypothetical protein